LLITFRRPPPPSQLVVRKQNAAADARIGAGTPGVRGPGSRATTAAAAKRREQAAAAAARASGLRLDLPPRRKHTQHLQQGLRRGCGGRKTLLTVGGRTYHADKPKGGRGTTSPKSLAPSAGGERERGAPAGRGSAAGGRVRTVQSRPPPAVEGRPVRRQGVDAGVKERPVPAVTARRGARINATDEHTGF